MSIIVLRNRDKNANGFFSLSDDARRRAREHLKSVGIVVEKTHPLIWPDDAVSAYRSHMYAPWEFTTKADILREKRKRMEQCLWWKREHGVVRRKPLYVWVFWCPGAFGFAFKGWWTYLIGLKGEYHGGGHKGEVRGDLFNQIKKMFPVVDPILFDTDDWKEDERWMEAFVRRYQRGKWGGKPQGKAPVWAEVQGDNLIKILGRAEWPVQSRKEDK